MLSQFSTGSVELDALLEELRAGDNVVFYTPEQQDYLPFVSSLLAHMGSSSSALVYVRAVGLLDEMVENVPGVEWLDLGTVEAGRDPLVGLEATLRRIGPRPYYLFEPLSCMAPWFGGVNGLRDLFLTLCPLLFQFDSVAYWSVLRGLHSLGTVTAIKDCTQVFLQVDRAGEDLLITPVKVLGRYSEAMFQPHRVLLGKGELHVHPQPSSMADQQAYTLALAEKNRELAEIRDALNRSNQELRQRNQELADLNARLSEQSRLYQSLRLNLEHLLALFRAGQAIGASLAVDQVRRAIVTAALRLFDAPWCRLYLHDANETGPVDISDGGDAAWAACVDQPEAQALRDRVCQDQHAQAAGVRCGAETEGQVAMSAIVVRGACLGTLEVYGLDARLEIEEVLTLLSYLASEASIALDNADLYREVEVQGKQLRSFVENVMTTEEQESRRLALDLHDGLVQLIVASYQHLQTAQAWRGRDPGAEEKEIGQGVDLLRRAIYEARRLITQLRPVGLDDFGLTHALRLYVAQLASDADWQVSLDVDPAWAPLPAALEAAIFRIVQEATTNALKYAAAPKVQIRLQVMDEQLRVTIRDWGKGFDPKQVAAEPQKGLHLGLIGIRERAHLWGGQCLIESQPGQGTTIEVRIPRPRDTMGSEGGRRTVET